jgi:myo-inositol-1(or 4)-monophosphatase
MDQLDRSRYSDWLALCRRAVARQQDALGAYQPADLRSTSGELGAGGDTTLEIDHDFEQIVLDEIGSLNPPASLVLSEEIGEASRHRSENDIAIVDPVDGSKNAAQGLPQFSLSVAVASGTTMADVWFGYVYDFGTREEYVAGCGTAPLLNGREIRPWSPPANALVSCESAEPALLGRGLLALDGTGVEEVRVIGSIAISLCCLAAGRFAGFLTCKDCRSVDAAAAQLIARQAGCEVRFDGRPPERASIDLRARYRLVAGCEPLLGELHVAQEAIPHVPR